MEMKEKKQELEEQRKKILQKMKGCKGGQCTDIKRKAFCIAKIIHEINQELIDKEKLQDLVIELEKEKDKRNEIVNFIDKAAKIVKGIIGLLS